MKRRIFLVCLFYFFLRLPIYESIAAIFWQSASYVFKFLTDFFRNGFPKSLLARFRSSLLYSQLKFFELYDRTCPAMFFCF